MQNLILTVAFLTVVGVGTLTVASPPLQTIPRDYRLVPMLQNFFVRNLRIFVISQSIFPCMPFQPCLMFVVSLQLVRVKHLKDSLIQGRLLALPTSARLCWKAYQGQTLQLLRQISKLRTKTFYYNRPRLEKLWPEFTN